MFGWLPQTLKISTFKFIGLTTAELFSAMIDLEKILYAEQDVANDLRQYIVQEEQRIKTLRSYASLFIMF